MCDHKPKKDTPELVVWEAEMVEFRQFIIGVNYRRIAILQKKQREKH